MSLSSWIARLAVPLAGLLVLAGWTFASPVGSSADEDFHLGSIWCADLENGYCTEVLTTDGPRYLIPDSVAGVSCFLDDYLESNLESASCATESINGSGKSLTHRTNNLAGYYPPYFYRVMNLFVQEDSVSAVLSMRIFNALLFVFMATAALALSRPWIRQPISISFLTTLIPFGAFFIPSINPSSWVIIGVSTFWVFLLSWLTTPSVKSGRAFSLLVLSGVSLFMAATARSDGALFVAASAVMAILIAWPQVKQHKRRLLIFLVPIPFLIWSFSFRLNGIGGLFGLSFSTQSEAQGTAGVLPLAGDLLRYAFEVPALIAGSLGANQPAFNQASTFFYGIGTIEVKMPSIVPLVTVGMVSAVLFLSLRVASKRRTLALLIGIAVLFLIPLLSVSRFAFQFAYSPRYIYPFVVALVALAMLVSPRRHLRLSRAQVVALGTGFAIANAVALLTTVRRYTNGQSETWLSFFFTPEWWWDFGPSPQVVVLIGSLAGVGVAIGLARIVYNPRLGSRVG